MSKSLLWLCQLAPPTLKSHWTKAVLKDGWGSWGNHHTATDSKLPFRILKFRISCSMISSRSTRKAIKRGQASGKWGIRFVFLRLEYTTNFVQIFAPICSQSAHVGQSELTNFTKKKKKKHNGHFFKASDCDSIWKDDIRRLVSWADFITCFVYICHESQSNGLRVFAEVCCESLLVCEQLFSIWWPVFCL